MFLGGRVEEKENRVMRVGAARLRAAAGVVAARGACGAWRGALALVVLCGLLATRLGTEFIPNLDEGDIAMHALRIPGTSLTQAVAMQATLESAHQAVSRGRARLRQARHRRGRHRPDAAVGGRHLRDAQAARAVARPAQAQGRSCVAEIEAAVTQLPGNNYEFTQPIQMRMNELISGVRADVAIKVYGDDLDTLVEVGERIEAVAAVGARRGRRQARTGHRACRC